MGGISVHALYVPGGCRAAGRTRAASSAVSTPLLPKGLARPFLGDLSSPPDEPDGKAMLRRLRCAPESHFPSDLPG